MQQFPKEQPAAKLAKVLPEVAIFMNFLRIAALPAEDIRYVGQLVAQRSAVSQEQAEKRVSDTYARLQEKLREARPDISIKRHVGDGLPLRQMRRCLQPEG